jgi:hypothetical protein
MVTAGLLALAALGVAATNPAKSDADGARAYWGTFVEPRDGLSRMATLWQFEQSSGVSFDALRAYHGLDDATLDGGLAALAKSRHGMFYLGVSAELGKDCVPWADVAAGRYDGQLRALASSIKDYGSPVFFAWNHEMANNCQTGTPAEYIASFNHVQAVFLAAGVSNVKYVWTPTAAMFRRGEAAAYEPPHYDVVGVDGYVKARAWRTPSAVFTPAHDFAVAHGKPLFIAEVGVEELPGAPSAKAQWLTDATALFQHWGVVGVMWTNQVNQRLDINYWVDSSPASMNSFRSASLNAYFATA